MNIIRIIVCLLSIILLLFVSSCSKATKDAARTTITESAPTPTATPGIIRIEYIIHDENCALKFSKGTVTDLNYKYIENPWRNTARVPVYKPVYKASCGCFKREYPKT